MKSTTKDKITMSIDPILIQAVDAAAKTIEKQTERCYQSRSKAEVKEDLEWGRIAAQQIKHLWND